MADVSMPQLGESVTEGTITKWFKQVGDHVDEDEALFEVSTDKVDSEVPSPSSGFVSEILVPEGETVDVGTLLVRLSDSAPTGPSGEVDGAPEAPTTPSGATAEDGSSAPSPAASAQSASAGAIPAAPAAAAPEPAAPVPAPAPAAPSTATRSGVLLSPLVRRLVEENGLDASTITGTGVGGRITREDVLDALDARAGTTAGAAITSLPPAAAAPAAAPAAAAPPVPGVARPAAVAGQGDTSVRLTNIRLRTGEHMVRSLQTSPHVITAIEVDYEAVERARTPAREQFAADEGFSLTYMPFVSRAVIDAIAEFPHLNASVGEGTLIVHQAVNLAIAVDLDFQGLLAPVIEAADGMRLRAIARAVHDVADRARNKQLSPDDLENGTFTISNSGKFGTLFVAPIINQPQVAILSTDGVTRRPVVVALPDGSESIAIHSMGNLTLSWDHRAFDGAYAAAFLAKVKEIIETRDWAAEL
ncbi:MAG: dihydrolipoamide acetyltransferase family protein [Microthrixaceae bacterium]